MKNRDEELHSLKSLLSDLESTINAIERSGDPRYTEDLEALKLRRTAVKARITELHVMDSLSAQASQLPEPPPVPPILSDSAQKQLSSTPSTPDSLSNNFSPSTFLGCAFAGAALLGILGWGAKDVKNMAAVRDFVHIVNSTMNPGRAENERRTF